MPDEPGRLHGTVGVLDTLRTAIYHGELRPGERLIEADLASRFKTSRGAVREALALLASEGMVQRERNRGARVRPVSLAEAIEITEVRAALEGVCAGRAAKAVTAKERRELKAIGKEMTAAVKANDILRYNNTSQQVHTRVRELADQHTITGILERLRYQSVRYQFHVALLPGRPAEGLQEHLAIIDSVCSGDADLAEKVMREHLLSVIGALHRLGELGSVFMSEASWLPAG
jgi:DNA-binding GntR family transcriptional regulator